MSICVLDSSAALAWVFPDENRAATDALLDQVAQTGAIVPGLWPLEVANVLLMAERRRRVSMAEREQALSLLRELPIQIDSQTSAQAWRETLNLADARKLTVYDASYLELALRLGLPLASLDGPLRQAASDCGVGLMAM